MLVQHFELQGRRFTNISILLLLKPVLGDSDGICVLKNRKRLVIYLILSPHTPALFTMSLIQAAGHTMRALTIMFSQLPNASF